MTDFIKTQKKKAIIDILNNLKSEFNVTSHDIISFLAGSEKEMVPIEIFAERKLSVMQALVKYMKDNLELSNKQISISLDKDIRSVWDAGKKADQRLKKKLEYTDSELFVPISIFKGSASLLKSLVVYLRELGWSNKKIANVLKRSETTISTVYTRGVYNG